MPHIEEGDLLALHAKIEREQDRYNILLERVQEKNKNYERRTRDLNIAWSTCAVFALCCIVGYYFFNSKMTEMEASFASYHEKDKLQLDSLDGTETLKKEMDSLRRENSGWKEGLTGGDVVYSVQVQAFEKYDISLRPDPNLSNYFHTQTYNGLYGFSIGIFETLGEARDFRGKLVTMGFEDAFVASYKDGSRIRIEDPW